MRPLCYLALRIEIWYSASPISRTRPRFVVITPASAKVRTLVRACPSS